MTLKLKYFIYLMCSMYIAGCIGLALNQTQDLFKSLTPFNLICSFLVLVLFQENKNTSFWVFLIVGFSLSYLSEIIGINTGMLFGNYSYEKTLGLKIWGTPPLIGINWLLLIISMGSLISKFDFPVMVKALLSALILAMFDVLIEPVAIHLEMWSWKNGLPTFKNYLDWFLISFIIFFIYYKLDFNKKNQIGFTIFGLQLIFFIIQFCLILL